jgi:hypothetical protein
MDREHVSGGITQRGRGIAWVVIGYRALARRKAVLMRAIT